MLEDFRLRVFLEVAKTGSFTLAARTLGVSQPAVSQNITALEKLVGVRLLARTRGEAYLTAEGRAFKDYAEKILYWYDAADAMFGTQGRVTVNRPLRIAADEVISSYLLPPTLATLYATHPDLAFTLSPLKPGSGIPDSVFEPTEEPDETVPGTHFGRPEDADVEISVSPSPATMDFEGESRLVGVMDAAVVASPLNRSLAYALQGDNRPFSTLAGVHVSNRFALWDRYRPFLTPDLLARVSVVSDSIEAVRSLVKASPALVGILPAFAVRPDIQSGALIQLPVQLPQYAFDIHYNPLPEFQGREVCKLLLQALRSYL